MKLFQQRRNMIIPRSSVNHASSCTDSRLKPIELVCRQSSKNSVAVIQPCQDQRNYQSDKPLPADRATDAVKLTQYSKSALPRDVIGVHSTARARWVGKSGHSCCLRRRSVLQRGTAVGVARGWSRIRIRGRDGERFARSYNRCLGESPQRCPGAEPLVRSGHVVKPSWI